MALSRKEVLNDLQKMFPAYDRNALNTLLRANDNLLGVTVDSILALNEEEQKLMESNNEAQEEESKENGDDEESAFADMQEPQPAISQPHQAIQLSKEEEEKRSKELIDELMAQEMQDQEQASYDKMFQENYALEQQFATDNLRRTLGDNKNLRNNNQVPTQAPVQKQAQKKDSDPLKSMEKTANKVGNFFKNTFKKIEDSLGNKKEVKQQVQEKQDNFQPMYSQQQYDQVPQFSNEARSQSTPIRHPKTQIQSDPYQKQIIEEIVFHHPQYISPTTYFNSIVSGSSENYKITPIVLDKKFKKPLDQETEDLENF